MRIGKTGMWMLAAAAAGLLGACSAWAGDDSAQRTQAASLFFFNDGGFHQEASFLESGRQRQDSGDRSPARERNLPGTGEESPGGDSSDYVPQTESVHVTIPGMEETRTLLWISDLHLSSGPEDPDVTPEHRGEAQERYEMFRSGTGLASEETWKLLSKTIDSCGADGVIFGADLLDYVSQENLEKLEEGLGSVTTPWMYLRADHDYGRWYSDMGIKRMRKLHRRVAPQNRLWIMRFEDFTAAGLDNSTTAVSEETLEEFRLLCEEGRPVILCTHVPFDSGRNDSSSLADLSRELWGDRGLCWGDGDDYDTSGGGCMKELLELITAPDSPVCAVLAGHLHTTWEGMLTDSCMEHVFSPAFDDRIGVITVSG